MVYFIQSGDDGPIKIGYTQAGRSMAARLCSLQVGNPQQLHLLAVLPEGGRQTEAWLHKAVRGAHIRGEWFRPTPLLEKIVEAAAHSPEELEQVVLAATATAKPAVGRPPSRREQRDLRRVRLQKRLQEQIDSGDVVVSRIEP